MPWFLNRAMTNFRAAVDARYPTRDKASDGTIGNEAHRLTSSDHNPDPDGSVDAWDMDVDLRTGLDPAAVEALKRAFERHESSSYWIHNDRISLRSEGWKPRSYAYAGPSRNRHDKHVHWNTRTSHEGSTAPWVLGEDDDMPANFTDEMVRDWNGALGALYLWRLQADALLRSIAERVDISPAEIAAIAAASQVDVDEAAIVDGVLAGLSPAAIAAAIPATIAKQVAAELATRLAS